MRCFKLHGTWSEATCIANQVAEKFECRDCHRGARIRKAQENRKGGKNRIEADVEELKKAETERQKRIEQSAGGGGKSGIEQKTSRKKRSAASLLIEGIPHPGLDFSSIFEPLPPDLPIEQDPTKLPPSMCYEIDFSQYPFLYEFIQSGQERFLRSPENMILYAVKKFYDLVNCRQGG